MKCVTVIYIKRKWDSYRVYLVKILLVKNFLWPEQILRDLTILVWPFCFSLALFSFRWRNTRAHIFCKIFYLRYCIIELFMFESFKTSFRLICIFSFWMLSHLILICHVYTAVKRASKCCSCTSRALSNNFLPVEFSQDKL